MKTLKAAVIGLGAVSLAATLTFAAPGDPFGGDDTGCAPATTDELSCENALSKMFGKLIVRIIKCHMEQAAKAFEGSGSGEKGCSQSAESKFNQDLNSLTNSGNCPAAVLTNAADQRDKLLADLNQTTPKSLDALNGDVFCDATSGTPIAGTPGDPDNDDAGYVPATAANLKCALLVSKNVAKLWYGLLTKCHRKAAKALFASKPFDEEFCENDNVAFKKGVRDKYNLLQAKLVAKGICPSCLDATGQMALGDAIQSRADSENGLIFDCP